MLLNTLFADRLRDPLVPETVWQDANTLFQWREGDKEHVCNILLIYHPFGERVILTRSVLHYVLRVRNTPVVAP